MFLHFLYLFDRNECEHLQALDNVSVTNVSPILIELVWRSLFRVEPYSALFCLAHFLALRVKKQSDSHCISVLAKLLSDKLSTAQHISPLIVTAELHITAVILEKSVEIVGLHYHVVELKESKTPFHSLLVALECKHLVYREASANVTKYVHIIKVKQPIAIVYDNSFVIRKINEV